MPEANLFLLFSRLNTLGVAYMVSGSVAVIIYGEPRLTHDVDLIVVLGREHIARLPEVFPPADQYHSPSPEAIQSAELEQQIAARATPASRRSSTNANNLGIF